jgi:hypothetical protein
MESTGSIDALTAALLYTKRRNDLFKHRLRTARALQTILLSTPLRALGLSAVNAVPGMLPLFVALTRG